MKTLKNISFLLIFSLIAFSCKENAPEIKTVDTSVQNDKDLISSDMAYTTATFEIEGMVCEMGCARTIEKRLAKMDGMKQAKVNFEEKVAVVKFDEAKLDTEKIEQAVIKVNDVYSVHNMKTVELTDK